MGVLLILIGLAILFERYYQLDIYFLRSYGLVLLGGVGLTRGIRRTPHRRIWISTFFLGVGLFYLFEEYGLYVIDKGLTIAVLPLVAGAAFLITFFLCGRFWKHLIYGGLITALGLFFLAYYINLVPGEIFITVIDDYWPLALVVLGVAYLIHGWTANRSRNMV